MVRARAHDWPEGEHEEVARAGSTISTWQTFEVIFFPRPNARNESLSLKHVSVGLGPGATLSQAEHEQDGLQTSSVALAHGSK